MSKRKTRMVKCKHCDFQRPAWSKVNGRNVSGMALVLAHVDEDHPEEADTVKLGNLKHPLGNYSPNEV